MIDRNYTFFSKKCFFLQHEQVLKYLMLNISF